MLDFGAFRGSIPGQETKIPHYATAHCGQTNKTKNKKKQKRKTNKQTTTTRTKPKLRETPPRRISSASEKCQIFRDGF